MDNFLFIIQNTIIQHLKITTGNPMMDMMLISLMISTLTHFSSYSKEIFQKIYEIIHNKVVNHVDDRLIMIIDEFYNTGDTVMKNPIAGDLQWYVAKFHPPSKGTVLYNEIMDTKILATGYREFSSYKLIRCAEGIIQEIPYKDIKIQIHREIKSIKTSPHEFDSYKLKIKNKNSSCTLFDFMEDVKNLRLNANKNEKWQQMLFNLDSERSNNTINKWKGTLTCNEKNFDTVIIPMEAKKNLVDDLRIFYESEKFYKSRGISWKRGYMFYGVPGTGKTSLIKAITYTWKLDIYNLDLKEIKDDDDLRKVFSAIPSKCAVVIEDIDCMGDIVKDRAKKHVENIQTKTKEQYKSNEVTLSAILNSVDGITSNNGRIFIFTTNFIDELDPALIRPGRVDFRMEMKYCEKEQIAEFFKLLTENEISKEDLDKLPKCNVTASEVSNLLLANRFSTRSAYDELKKMMITKRNDEREKSHEYFDDNLDNSDSSHFSIM